MTSCIFKIRSIKSNESYLNHLILKKTARNFKWSASIHLFKCNSGNNGSVKSLQNYCCWWRIIFAEWLIDKRRHALFPIEAIARDFYHCKPRKHALSKIRTCAWSEFRLYLMTLCSSGNHCIITPLTYWRNFCVFIVNLEQISQIALVFPFLTLNK